ncbi:hypothetical protein DFH08DRAFT_792607 [Mycena albidolilacea]|uniref:Uncharacterized protein n=1 Tax=Mycena albidolilacea TaxID=1033008 RepID=A0AAD6Z583_9AGAR|nr:hypothetical protein DFH08DRAFT_792607 [Mycena albidolilacea]
MVVTRKTPVAPVPVASRTNSAHALPRAAKPKTNSTLAAETDKEAAAKNVPAVAASPKPPPKSKHKNRHQKKAIKSSNGWLDRLAYLSLSLFALYALTTCPHDSTLSNPVCRSLSQYRTHVLEPYVLPPIYRALEHPTVAPYVEKAQHIERTALRPTYEKYLRPAYKRSAPYAAAAKRALWDRAAVPAFHAYVAPQYRKHVLPQWHKHAAPLIARAAPYAARAQHGLERTAYVLRKTYSTRVAPAVSRAYAVGKPWAIRGYRTARPHAVALYVLVADKAGAARRAYVDPHVRRIWEKVLELSGAGPVGSPTEQAAPVPEKEPEPTAATAEGATTEQVASETSVEATVTAAAGETSSSAAAPPSAEEVPEPTEASASSVLEASSASSVVPPVEAPVTVPAVETSSSAATPSAEEEVPEPTNADASASSVLEASSASSVVPPVEASTVVPAKPSSLIIEATSTPETTPGTVEPEMNAEMKAEILEELSAASIALQSAHGMESPVVEEILADVKSSVKATPTGSAVPEPSADELPEEDDSALLDFLGGIGLDGDFFGEEEEPFVSDIAPDDDADLELTQEEIDALKAKEAAEQAAAKTRGTAEKRADLEGRMAQSIARLPEVVAEKTRILRETLAGLRKSAVGTLDDAKTEVGGAVPSLRKEGDKLLAGLEGYLKKEAAKTKKGGDPAERAARWETIVGKVEDKLGESIHSAQGVLQAFHVEEKAKEVDEGMYIIQEMKDACSQAQGNVGLELSWLDDVTYHDWEVYHSLAKFGEDFQATASAIQAGTHEDSPADPFIARLEEEQKALGDLVNELIGRINTLKQQAAKTFAPEPVPEAPPTGSEAEEPEVSILPVPPVAEPGVVDPAQVIVGKSAEQVKQAVRIAEEHKEL